MDSLAHPRHIPALACRVQRGFTTIELMMTITILGVLLTIAAPAFRDFVLDQRVKNASFELNVSLQYARSEAVKRNDSVSVTPISGNWTNGYDITAGGDTLKSVAAADGITISGPDIVTFRRDGRASQGGNSDFIIAVSPARPGVSTRCVHLEASGLPNNVAGASC